MMRNRPILLLTLALSIPLAAQQEPDTDFRPPIARPAFARGRGPVVFIDEAHFNFHTASGRYRPFAELLRRDGFFVEGSRARFSEQALRRARLLVIANARAENSPDDWSLPTPAAFTTQEIVALMKWVKSGRALLLIADHKPFAGAASTLAAAFGVRFIDGYAIARSPSASPMLFRRGDGTLVDHAVTKGIDSVATFTGSAFETGRGAEPLLVFGPGVDSVQPSVQGALRPDDERRPVQGWLQGAVLRFGKGRVAVFGEAAMFSAQRAGPQRAPMGMNHPQAAQNSDFLLNLVRWLVD